MLNISLIIEKLGNLNLLSDSGRKLIKLMLRNKKLRNIAKITENSKVEELEVDDVSGIVKAIKKYEMLDRKLGALFIQYRNENNKMKGCLVIPADHSIPFNSRADVYYQTTFEDSWSTDIGQWHAMLPKSMTKCINDLKGEGARPVSVMMILVDSEYGN